ncbi:unnamed protein product, partial [Rotaria socialis]
MCSIVFQQGGAPPHFAAVVRKVLDKTFSNTWVGRGGRVRWAPRSPDLTSLDFYLWGHMENSVHKTPIKNIAELKQKIKKEITSISKATL